jgi:hypothetical protein
MTRMDCYLVRYKQVERDPMYGSPSELGVRRALDAYVRSAVLKANAYSYTLEAG